MTVQKILTPPPYPVNPGGQLPITLVPEPVLANMVRTGQIPTKEVKLADERYWCKYALRGDSQGAAACPSLRREPGRQWCALNGPEQANPCVFDEPESAEIWERIRAYLATLPGLGVELPEVEP